MLQEIPPFYLSIYLSMYMLLCIYLHVCIYYFSNVVEYCPHNSCFKCKISYIIFNNGSTAKDNILVNDGTSEIDNGPGLGVCMLLYIKTSAELYIY